MDITSPDYQNLFISHGGLQKEIFFAAQGLGIIVHARQSAIRSRLSGHRTLPVDTMNNRRYNRAG
ncbi:hypothetical protein MJO28_004833 [Puccinia striiformis f. sp. tritici]|uniref:Uncharacterized protein n=1 Tax=Puccinia striiformis f. sp. tritici TaxID=168172 RepID=A0ACC0EKU9_9BASI|nr:hypothetical protein MJO28_004833 [Puccinia striiformis f. sp. tritici]